MKHWTFKEVFAGTAHLTKVFRSRGHFNVSEPIELYKRGKINLDHDILNDKAFDRLCQEAARPKQYWHFGFPCGSFSLLQNLNKGTRSRSNLMGNGSVKREVVGNTIMLRTLKLCQILHNNGSFFTLENPLSSYAWKTPAMLTLFKRCACKIVHFDQCQYGLRIPATENTSGLALKPTTMAGTLPFLHLLGRRCQKNHEHVAVIGGVRHKGKWRKRSELAGSYPFRLCQAIAKAFEQSFA